MDARRNYTLLRGGPLSSVTHNQPPHSETPTIALARKGIALSIRMDRLQSRIIEPIHLARGKRQIRNANWRIVTYSTFSGGSSWEPLRGVGARSTPQTGFVPIPLRFSVAGGERQVGNKPPITLRRRFNLFEVPICRKTGKVPHSIHMEGNGTREPACCSRTEFEPRLTSSPPRCARS